MNMAGRYKHAVLNVDTKQLSMPIEQNDARKESFFQLILIKIHKCKIL